MSEASFKYHKYMIKSAPYGELTNVVQNLEKVSPFDLNSQQAQQTFRQFNEEHLSLIKIDGKDSTIPIMQVARDENGNYIDQIKAKAYQVNHITRQLQNQADTEVDLMQPVAQLLQILSKKLHTYVDKYYKQPFGSQVFMEVTEEGTLNVHVGFTSKNVQLSNFCTGEWNSLWTINKTKIQGKVSIRSHIFESCNVQMNQDKTITQDFVFSANMEENANKIIKAIETSECQIQKSLGQIYEEMPNGFFKHLRRIVPVTKTTMIWNVNALKMNRNLQQTKK